MNDESPLRSAEKAKDSSGPRVDEADEAAESSAAEAVVEASRAPEAQVAKTHDDGETEHGTGRKPPRLRAYILPLLTLVALSVLLISFRTVLLPFIFACLVVYLMEPVVSRIGRTPGSPSGLPRWAAVIVVYLVFLGIVTISAVTIVPRFVSEFVHLGDTIPAEVQKFRAESLPSIDEKLQDLIEDYVPADSSGEQVYWDAREAASAARSRAAARALVVGQVRHRLDRALDLRVESRTTMGPDGVPLLRHSVVPSAAKISVMTLDDATGKQTWRYGASAEAAIRLVPDTGGGVRVYLSDVEIEVAQAGEGRWLVRRRDHERLPRMAARPVAGLNLQRSLDELISGLVDTSTEGITTIIGYARTLVLGVIKGFVAIILTMMVAAFISIDLYRVKGFFRQLIPDDGKLGYDRFLSMADRGLGGVVRGQLLICLVNGVFTWVGLAIIGVKFSVLLGVVAGILSVIPVFGTILSTAPIVLIGLTGGLTTGVLALGWILLIHFVEANLLNPKIIGSSAHIHPVIVIFALLAGESAYGLVGALLAVPTASLILTLFNFVRLKSWRESSEAAADAAQRT